MGRVIKERNIALCIIFSIITCGIYGIYWYINMVDDLNALSGHEDALFLSIQDKRISVRAVENLVKKYASRVTTMKKITPHKLRSTFGSNLYQESGDIYLVADVLGHKDVNTTQKHYAARYDEQGRRVQKMVHLRKD